LPTKYQYCGEDIALFLSLRRFERVAKSKKHLSFSTSGPRNKKNLQFSEVFIAISGFFIAISPAKALARLKAVF